VKSVTFDCHDPLRLAAFFDLRVMGDLEAERDRLVGLGATVLADQEGLYVMADPEGNEFCLES
jgi:hypothetical protein